MSEFLHFFVDPELLDRHGLRLLDGLLVTAKLVAISFSLGLVLGLLLALARNSGSRALRGFAGGYIYLFRGSPLLAQLFLLYYGVGSFREFWQDLGLWWFFRDAWFCALLAFTLNTAAYQAEIFRGSLLAIAPGQYEAGFSRTFDFQLYLWAAVLYLVLVELIRRGLLRVEGRLGRHLN